MNDRHPSGTAHAAPAPDAASAAHGSYEYPGQQGVFTGHDGYGTPPATGFDADPLFGDMSGGTYDTTQWQDSGGYQAEAYDAYSAPQDPYGTGSYQTTGGWAEPQQADIPAQSTSPEATGQWQAQPAAPQGFDAAAFETQTGGYDTGQFATGSYDTGTYDTSGYASPGYAPQAPEADWSQQGYQPQPFTEPQGYGTPGHESPGYESSAYETPGYGTPGLEAPGYEAPGGYEHAGYHATGYDSSALPPQDYGTAAGHLTGHEHPVHPYESQAHPSADLLTDPLTDPLSAELPATDYAPQDYAGPDYASADYANADYGDLGYDHTAYGSAAPAEAPEFGAHSVPAQAGPAPAEAAYDATDPLNPTGSYETTGFDTATFEAIYEAPAYPEEPRYETGDFTGADAAPQAPTVDPDAWDAAPAELPEVAPYQSQEPAEPGARGRARRRGGAKRSALLTVAVPSACVMGVAGIAAASVGDFADGEKKPEAKTSAPDATRVEPTVANSKLDTQLQGLTADAGDFADRASRTQERIDLKAKKEAERKRAAEEAARKERLRPKFMLPVKQQGLSAQYGQAGVNWMSLHTGIDFPVSYGTPVMAVTDGTVRTQYNSAYGNMAIVTAKDGTETWYCHLSSTRIFSGEVKAGDVIAYSGNSGNSTGPHLHFEVRPGGGSAINPLPWLQSHGLNPL